MILEGLALPFGVWCWHDDLRGYSRFAPGSFAALLPHNLIRLNVHHQQERTLAAQDDDDNRLQVWEERDGLYFRAELEATPLARFVAEAVRFGIAKHVCPSIVADGHDEEAAPGEARRITQSTVRGCDLAILMAAKGHYPQTWVRVR